MSYQLTLTFESAQQMGRYISEVILKNEEVTLAVHLDEMDTPTMPQPDADAIKDALIRERLWGEAAMADNAKERAKLAKRAARADRKIVDARMFEAIPVSAETEEMMRRRQEAYDARYTLAQEARAVECTSCGAMVNHPCTSPSGPYGAFVHSDRIRALQMTKRNG